MIKRIIDFITNDIWQKKESEFGSRKVRWGIRQLKILIFTARGVSEHGLIIRSAALTFYTLMSIVPIAALIFGVVKGFGMETNFNEYLYMQFPQYSTLIDNVIEFANKLLLRTRGGVVASVGFVVLLWSVMKVFGNIESAFNYIWEVRKPRSLARKFSDYITVVFVAPILWIISNSLAIYVRTHLAELSDSGALDVLFSFVSLISMWLLFAFIYYVMPNTRVKIVGALIAGVIAGTVFQIFQVAYVYIQTQVSSYNAIYGSFAALPLFLIWLQSSWQILLFGAELSFAYQNVSRYEQEREAMHMSVDQRRKVMVAAMLTIVRHFMDNRGPVNSEDVASELDLPVRTVRDVVFALEKAGLVVSVRSDADEKVNLYTPARDVHELTVYDVVSAVECSGSSSAININATAEAARVSGVIDRLQQTAFESPENVRLTDLI